MERRNRVRDLGIRKLRDELVQRAGSRGDIPFVSCHLCIQQKPPALAEAIGVPGGLVQILAPLAGFAGEPGHRRQLEVRLGEGRVDLHGLLQRSGGLGPARVRERIGSDGIQPESIERGCGDVGGVPNARRGEDSHAVANARGKLIDERKRIGASHALRGEDSAACKILHARVNPNVRAVLVDAAGDDGAGAGMLRHLGGLVELECFEIRMRPAAVRPQPGAAC